MQDTPFKKHKLTEEEIRGVAALCLQEQGCLKGVMAEASLMCNLFEGQTKHKTLVDYVVNSGWFARAKTFYEEGVAKSVGKQYDEAVKRVVCDGLRVLPAYVNEHDCFCDIESAENDGVGVDKKDRNVYKQGLTKIKNCYDSAYTFYCFPDSICDPFGYIKKGKSDSHYDYDGNFINLDKEEKKDSDKKSPNKSVKKSIEKSKEKSNFPFMGQIIAENGLNMRAKPDSSAEKSTKMPTQPHGTKVKVIRETVNDKKERWYFVEKNGNRAYCSAKYVKKFRDNNS